MIPTLIELHYTDGIDYIHPSDMHLCELIVVDGVEYIDYDGETTFEKVSDYLYWEI